LCKVVVVFTTKIKFHLSQHLQIKIKIQTNQNNKEKKRKTGSP
jgi:hypothetical protein